MVVGGSNENGLLDDVEIISTKANDECSKAVNKISGLWTEVRVRERSREVKRVLYWV